MLSTLGRVGSGRVYWLAILALGLALESAALYYQYVLDYGPCILCIHIRLWIAGLMLVSLLALAGRGRPAMVRVCHVLTVVMAAGFLERSWMSLGVERGTVIGECNMDLGLPEWFAVDRWLPAVFEPWEACGYTPYLLFGVTMAEALVAISAVLVAVAVLMTVASVLGRR
jgi:disulfide bond formation protein DsbB